MATRHRHRPRRAPSIARPFAPAASFSAVPAPEVGPLPSLRFVYLDDATQLRMEIAGCAVGGYSSIEVNEAIARLRAVRSGRARS